MAPGGVRILAATQSGPGPCLITSGRVAHQLFQPPVTTIHALNTRKMLAPRKMAGRSMFERCMAITPVVQWSCKGRAVWRSAGMLPSNSPRSQWVLYINGARQVAHVRACPVGFRTGMVRWPHPERAGDTRAREDPVRKKWTGLNSPGATPRMQLLPKPNRGERRWTCWSASKSRLRTTRSSST